MTALAQPSSAERTMRAVRRLRFAPTAADLDLVSGLDSTQAITKLRETAVIDLADDPANFGREWDSERYDSLLQWLLGRLLTPNAGLHERMVWFWHGHLTSSVQKASRNQMYHQQQLLRRHATGNFRQLMLDITLNPAMLRYLDGDRSVGSNPNENYARELMELFVLGIGHYEEADIRSAAKAFSGWTVGGTSGRGTDISFDPEKGFDAPLTFLGERRRWDHESIVNRVCDHPACAPFITAKLHRFIAGSTAPADFAEELARIFVDNNLELQPVLDAILAGPTFLDAAPDRVRQPIEWLTAAAAVLGHQAEVTTPDSPAIVETWWFDQLGQVPFAPPNVAGWPDDDRWVSAGQVLARTNLLSNIKLPATVRESVEPTVDAVLRRCALSDVSDTTRRALEDAERNQPVDERRLELLLSLAVLSPEFSLA